VIGRNISLNCFLDISLLIPAVRKEGRLSSRSDHQSKSIAQTGSWGSVFSQNLERLVELENMFKENKSSESLGLDLRVEVSN
jgi:hypothetical protein